MQKIMNAKIEKECPPKGRGSRGDSNSLSEELEYLWDERDAAGKIYEIYLGRISRSPVVRSKLSGKYFLLPWSQVIALAAKAKINL
ncbi:MAG TPA: hypothetical protein VMF08_16020 [Candidatus Sulfotelmatobacter sp.]|nr:hypothetical protein [Candidatus Sulfotelmatobacter sp.]